MKGKGKQEIGHLMRLLYQRARGSVLLLSRLAVLVISLCGVARAQSATDAFLNYKITAHYPDHTVVAYAKPVKGVSLSSERQYYWFAANQVKMTQGGYSGKLLNGGYQDFYMNKSLKEEGYFEKGLKIGVWKSWRIEGTLKDEASYNKGKKNGLYLQYDSVGKITERGSYREDLLDGKQERFIGDSTIVVYYKEGQVIDRKNFMSKVKNVPKAIKRLFHHKKPVLPVVN